MPEDLDSIFNIYYLLKTKATQQPEAMAIVAPERSPLTYQDLLLQVEQVGFQLRAMGIKQQDRVAIALPNSPEMAVIFLGVAANAICAPLNPAYRSQEFDFYLRDLDAKALITQAQIVPSAIKVAKERGIAVIELIPTVSKAAGLFTLDCSETEGATFQNSATPKDIALILHTSGTTSRPKIVPLTQANLCYSAQNIALALELHNSDRCLNVMPLFHIHGLVGVLLSSLRAGGSVVCTEGFNAPQFLSWLDTFAATWYSAVPTMHQSILARIEAENKDKITSHLRFIRSSSAPLPPQVMAQLEATFQVPVIEAYGMTEASHQMTSNPLPPRQRKPGSVGIASGLEVAIMDEKEDLLPLETIGEVVIRGNNVTQGYENNPDANEKAFTKGWFRTGDLGYLDADGYLFLKGRIKEIINRGGEKISPREIDEVLLNHPSIDRVVAFAAPHTLLGEEVAVAVVLKDNASVTELEIKEFAAQRLADFKVPRVVIFIDEIPKGPTGKMQRIGLAEKLGLKASDPTLSRPEFLSPQTPIEKELVKIWSEVLKIETIGIHDNFFQLGGDSILATQIVNRIRESLQVELSFLIFFQQPTIANMAIAIAQQQAQNIASEDINNLLEELDSLSDAEVQNLLNN